MNNALLDSSFLRLWAVVDTASKTVCFADYRYTLVQSFRDRIWASWKQFYFEGKVEDPEDYKSRFVLVRYDLNRGYVYKSPFEVAAGAFTDSLLGKN